MLDTLRQMLRGPFPVGLAVAGLDGTLLAANARFARLTGYDEDELVGRHPTSWTHPDDVAATLGELERLRRGLIAETVLTKRYRTKAGVTVWVRSSLSLVRDEDGEPRYIAAAVDDITAYRVAEADLESERRAMTLLDETGKLLASTADRSTLLQAITDAATSLTGAAFGAFFHTAKSGEAGKVFSLYTLSGARRSDFDGFGHPRQTPLFAPTFAGQGPVRCDDVQQDPRYGQAAPHHGMPPRHLPVRSYLAVPVVSRNGEVLGALLFGHPQPGVFTERSERLAVGIASHAAIALDNAVTYDALRDALNERDRLLEAERAARGEAERVSRVKDEFLAVLSHELRTPLNAMLGWAQLMQSRRLPEAEQQRGLLAIQRNARMQAQLVDDLLDLNRISTGKITLRREEVDLAAVVGAAVEAVRPLAQEKALHLQTSLSPGIEPVLGDTRRLQQVFWNLLSNAVKFTPRGGEIFVDVLALNSFVQITVRDTGIGISEEFLPHVFERFRQADASTTRSHGGLGVGLALVKSFVELHEGWVTASSGGPNRGAEFTVVLPAASPAKLDTVAEPRIDFDVMCKAIAGTRVALIDDEADARDIIAQLLRTCGVEVSEYERGAAALEAIPALQPDVVICDLGMPEMDGFSFIRALRALPIESGGALPAIALTAFAREEDRERALAAGYTMHLAKPAEANGLLAAVRTLSGSARAA